jgi:solute carrier family 35 (UDP-sugar transporter), member A1/2/3
MCVLKHGLLAFIDRAYTVLTAHRNYRKGHGWSMRRLTLDVFGAESQALQITVPAVLYFVQNNLQYVAVSNLDAATFQVTYQLQILTTALFSVMLLRRKLSPQKWYALLLLTAGIALVQLPTGKSGKGEKSATASGIAQLAGLAAVMVACIISGIAGVW